MGLVPLLCKKATQLMVNHLHVEFNQRINSEFIQIQFSPLNPVVTLKGCPLTVTCCLHCSPLFLSHLFTQ